MRTLMVKDNAMRTLGRAYHDCKQAADAELNEIKVAADKAWWADDKSTGVRAIRTMFSVLDGRSGRCDRMSVDAQTHRSRQHRH